VIPPIGSTEQHGPIGLIGTDAICAEVTARGAGDACGAPVAPTVAIGMAQHHLGFTGSVTLRPTALIAVLSDIVESLARCRFARFYFINGHGGNVAVMTAAFSEIYVALSLATVSTRRRLQLWRPTISAGCALNMCTRFQIRTVIAVNSRRLRRS
jgi:creatinine amidohydrolase